MAVVMPQLSRFQKEQALRANGVMVPPYPVVSDSDETLNDVQAAWDLLDAGTAWELEVERLYLQMIVSGTEQIIQADATQHFRESCEANGIIAALEEFNGRVPHRYTAIYRLEGALLRNVQLVDKAHEARPEFLEVVPIDVSFCQFVLKDGCFLTCNSASDDRLNGHPYKGVMVAYHGVPIPNAAGGLFGTLCHFDVHEQQLSDTEFENLRGIAQVLPFYLS
jgi:GAF domain-containing protein